MKRLSETHDTLSVVTDEVGQPTWTVDLADLIVRLIDAKAPSGYLSRDLIRCQTQLVRFHQGDHGIDWGLPRRWFTKLQRLRSNRPVPSIHRCLDTMLFERIGVDPIGPWKDRWAARRAGHVRRRVVTSPRTARPARIARRAARAPALCGARAGDPP